MEVGHSSSGRSGGVGGSEGSEGSEGSGPSGSSPSGASEDAAREDDSSVEGGRLMFAFRGDGRPPAALLRALRRVVGPRVPGAGNAAGGDGECREGQELPLYSLLYSHLKTALRWQQQQQQQQQRQRQQSQEGGSGLPPCKDSSPTCTRQRMYHRILTGERRVLESSMRYIRAAWAAALESDSAVCP